jgi:uncharacterized protein RhaS with RHS repeats
MFIVVLFVSFVSTALSYYVPEQGRWMNRDPVGEAGGVNLYGFNLNNPVDRIDTDGRSSLANPANAAVVAEAEAAAAGFPSYAAMQAAAREAARRAALYGAAATALSQSQCKPKNDDPCKRFNDLRNYLRQEQNEVLKGVSNVIKAKGTQADLNAVPGLTPELKEMIGAMYDSAADCFRGKRDVTFNEERAKFLRGQRSTGPGSNLPGGG